MTALLDANVLIALGVADHVHHDVVEEWFTALEEPFASCPMTQGALVRLVLREGASAAEAVAVLAGVTSHPGHDFWPDDLGYEQVTMAGVVGHRQVTDAYLAALTRHRGGRLATLDRGLALLHHDVALLIHVDGPEGPTGTRDSTAAPCPRTQTGSRRGPSGGVAEQTSQQRRSVDDEESASAEGRIDPMELLLQSKLRRKGPRRFPHLVATALRLAWQASPRSFAAAAGLQLLGAVAVSLLVVVGKFALDAILAAEDGARTVGALVPVIVLLAVVSALGSVATALQSQAARRDGPSVPASRR